MAKLNHPGVAEIILGQSPPSSAYNDIGEGLPFFQGKADFGLLHPVPRIWCDNGQKFAIKGDVLMSVRAPVGDVNIAMNDCVIGRGIAALRAGKKTDPWFLYFALEYCKPVIKSLSTGSTFASVNKTTLADLDIPFPHISEQQGIGKALVFVINRINEENRLYNAFQDLKRAAMGTLFTRGLKGEMQKETDIGLVPESWDVVTVSSHFSVISGGTPSRTNTAYWNNGSIPWVKTGEVNYEIIKITEERITSEGLANSAAKLLPVGTLLMAMYGQGVTRGRVAILGIEAACNQACAAINSLNDKVLPSYLFHFLTYRYEAIRHMAHGGQQQNLNLEIVKDLALIFPNDSSEQVEIVAILDAIDRKIDLHKKKRAVLNELFKSLLHKLMTGEIRVADLDLSALEKKAVAA